MRKASLITIFLLIIGLTVYLVIDLNRKEDIQIKNETKEDVKALKENDSIIVPEEYVGEEIIYKSLDENIVKINDEGKVKTVSNGKTKIMLITPTENIVYDVDVQEEKIEITKKEIQSIEEINNTEIETEEKIVENKDTKVVEEPKEITTEPEIEEIKEEPKEETNISAENTKLVNTPVLNIKDTVYGSSISINTESTKHVSKVYEMSKSKKITINVSGEASNYVYSTATSQTAAMEDIKNKKSISTNTPINVEFLDGKTKVFYIWLVDNNGKKSTHFTRLALTPAPVKVQKITLNNTNVSINVGKNYKLSVTVTPEDANNKKVIWESLNELIAKVDSNGNITPVREGMVYIKATSEDGNKVATAKINVKSSMFNEPRFITMMSGETKKIKPKLKLTSLKSTNSSILKVINNNDGTYSLSAQNISDRSGFVNVVGDSDTGIREYIRVQVFNTNALGCAYSGKSLVCSKKTSKPLKNKTNKQKENDEKELDYIYKQLSYNKRYNAVEFAKYLSIYYDTQVSYEANDIFTDIKPLKRLNAYTDSCWNCPYDNSFHGIQCSGFVSWTLMNSDIKMADSKYTKTVYISATYLAGAKTPADWIKDNNKNAKVWYGSDDNKKIVSDKNIKPFANGMTWNELYNLVTPGDLIGKVIDNGEEKDNDKAHIGIIVDKYIENGKKYILVSHSADWGVVNGPQITRYNNMDELKQNWSSADCPNNNCYSNIVLMDEFYKK